MPESMIEGGCLCGAVRYRVDARAMGATRCHCETCRRSTGAPAPAWVIFPSEGFAFIAGTPKVFRSSPHIERTFCGDCGTSLAYCSERRPDVVDILTATLDAPEAYPPDREIWLGEKIPWDLVDASLPNYPRSSKG